MTEGAQFPNILLGARGTTASGALNVNASGITWKKDGGMNPQVFKKEDIAEVIWSRAPGGCLLRIRQHDKVTINLHGFSTGDEARLKDDLSSFLGMGLASQEMDASGHNWGQLKVHGSSLAFESMEGKHIFELPLTEIGDVQGTKEDVILEFHIDDGTISQKEDGLCSITFVVPDDHENFPAEDGKTGAEVFKEAIMGKTDALAGEGDALAELEHVACIFPRGRYDLSIFPSFMVMDGQNSQFRIRYSNIDRIYQLPRPQPAGNLVLVHLENAIRRGQTYYEWIAFFFDANAYVDDLNLNATEEFLTKKNEENRANMELVMSGPKEDVLTRLLRGLSGAKVTKQGKFTASDDSPFLSCNHRNDAGVLYPLQRAFLYTFKPELIPYDHISSVEFERQQSGMHAATVRTFDLSVSIRPEAATRTKSFLFRGIMKQEWEPLLNFMEEKNIRISNLDQARQGPGFAPAAPLAGMDLGGDEDEEDDEFGGDGMAEEDGDFDAGGGSGSDSSDNDSDAELIPEEGISVEAVGGMD